MISGKRLRALTVVASAVLIATQALAGCTDPAGPEMSAKLAEDFTTKPDGPVAETADSSQVWTQTASRPQAVPTISGGAFTNADTSPGPSANYLTARLRGSVTHAAAEFDFGPTGTDGENVTLIASSRDLPGGTNGPGLASDLMMHVAFTSSGWIWSNSTGGSGALTTVKSVSYGSFQPGSGLQKVSVVLDAQHNTAKVQGADGKVTEVADSAIGTIRSPFMTFEVYYGAAESDKRANVRKVEADSLPIGASKG
jgi:hypothetical protein